MHTFLHGGTIVRASVKYMLLLGGVLLNVMAIFILFTDVYLRIVSYPLGLAGGFLIGLALASSEEVEQASVIRSFAFSEVPSTLLQTALSRFPQMSIVLRGERE